ncbi:MAG: YkgJ family cysteine cluster protein [Patescibacteria group bacterium]
MIAQNLIGTFEFCKGCPTSKSCCTGKTVDRPVLTPRDIFNISQNTKLSVDQFSVPVGNGLSEMKLCGTKCIFYKKGHCTLYNTRPIDCKIFPFDIRRNKKKELMLVWYTTACPKKINAEVYEQAIRPLLAEIQPYFDQFADNKSPLLDRQKYRIIECPIQKPKESFEN